MADQRVPAQAVLEDGRRHVLAGGGHDQLLLAAGDAQEAVVVQLTDVAAVEPAVDVERLSGGGLVVPVPLEDVVAEDEDLPVVGDRKSTRLNSSHPSISYAV